MKKVIEIKDLCCKRCAERAEKKLLLDGVSGARADFRKNRVFVETELPDSALTACLELAGFVVDAIRPRKGIFG